MTMKRQKGDIYLVDNISFMACSLFRLTGSIMNSQTSFRNMLSSKNESSPLKQSNRRNWTSCDMVLEAAADTTRGVKRGSKNASTCKRAAPDKHAAVSC